MKKSTWKLKIKSCCEGAGTYKPYFNHFIDSLAEILEKRDMLMWDYEIDDDEKLVIETAKNGRIINPLITEWKDMNKLALQYWKELGLTPAALKKLNDNVFEDKKTKTGGNSLLGLLEKQKEQDK